MDRRSLISGGSVLLAAQLLPRKRRARQDFDHLPDDAKFMQMAIDQSKNADYPFGAVIVRDGRVLALGRNSTRRISDPTAHAEMMAIRAFLDGHEPADLKEATLYSSGEPCVMCMGAIIWCGSSAWCLPPRSPSFRHASARSTSPPGRSLRRRRSRRSRSPAGCCRAKRWPFSRLTRNSSERASAAPRPTVPGGGTLVCGASLSADRRTTRSREKCAVCCCGCSACRSA